MRRVRRGGRDEEGEVKRERIKARKIEREIRRWVLGKNSVAGELMRMEKREDRYVNKTHLRSEGVPSVLFSYIH